MADLQKTVSIIFNGDDRVSSTITSVSGRIDALEAGVMAIANPLAEVADGVLKLDAALALAAAGGLAYAYTKSKQFETSQVELQKVMGDNPEAVRAASDAAIHLSNVYGESAAEILLSTAEIKQAGFNVEEALMLTKNTMDLAIAGSMDAADANEILIATLKGFDAPAKDAARLIDILNGVSNEYATDVGELGTGIAALSPILKQMGFTFEEGAGLLTPVIEVFRSGNEAANGLKAGLLNLINDTPRVTDALESIGVAQKDSNGDLRSAKDILRDVQVAWAGLTDTQRVYITQELAGKEQAARMAVVFDSLAKQVAVTETAYRSAGSAAAEVSARLESSEVQVKRVAAAWENLFVLIGDQFRDAADDALAGATDIELALQQIVKDGTFEPIFASLRGFAERLGEFLSEVAKAAPDAFAKVDFSKFLDAIGNVGAEIEGYFEGIDLSTAEGLGKGIQFVVDSVSSLITVTAGMVDAFEPVFDGLVSMIEGFNQLDVKTQMEAGNILAAAKVVADAGLLVSAAIVSMGEHAEEISFAFYTVVNTISGFGNLVKAVWNGVLNFVVDSVKMLWDLIDAFDFGVFEDEVRVARDHLTALSDSLKKDFWSATDKAITNLTGLELGLGNVADQADTAGKAIGGIPEAKDVVLSASDTATDRVADLVAWMKKVPERKETTVSAATDMPSIQRAKDVIEQSIPVEKRLKIEADIEIAKIQAQADTIQTMLEWDAKVNIEQIKAATEQIKSAFESVNTGIESTGDTLASLFGLMADDDLSLSKYMDVMDAVSKEQDRRDQEFALQERLTTAQIDMLNAQRAQLDAGGGLIQITADGLEPELEAFMWKIIEKIQIRGIESASEFLLGV